MMKKFFKLLLKYSGKYKLIKDKRFIKSHS